MSVEPFISTALVTCFFSYGVQALFFAWFRYKKNSLIKKHKTVFHYLSGVVGDGLLVPLTNVFAVLSLVKIQADLFIISSWIVSFIGGFLITFMFHFGQERFKLTNWTMPKVGKWNTLGLYHAFFMFFESSFLLYSLLSYLTHAKTYGFNLSSSLSMDFGLAILLIFLATFIYDYRQTVFKKILPLNKWKKYFNIETNE